MSVLERVLEMQEAGKNSIEIIEELRSEGLSEGEISSSLAQAQIKTAVNAQPEDIKENESFSYGGNNMVSENTTYPGMSPSMMNVKEQEVQQIPQYTQPEQSYQDYAPQQEYNQQYTQQYSPASSDIIAEISEQIVAEKTSSLKAQMEKVLESKNLTESKIELIEQRLRRIEAVIDKLQMSVLQKVGDYMNNVETIKNEITETQKT